MFAGATHRIRYYAVGPSIAGAGGGLPMGRALAEDYGYHSVAVSRVALLEEGRATETTGNVLAPLRSDIAQGMAVRVAPVLEPTAETWWQIDGIIPNYGQRVYTLHLAQRGWANTEVED